MIGAGRTFFLTEFLWLVVDAHARSRHGSAINPAPCRRFLALIVTLVNVFQERRDKGMDVEGMDLLLGRRCWRCGGWRRWELS
jgi:hypothetical protein